MVAGAGGLSTVLQRVQAGKTRDTPAEGKGRAAAAATFQTFLQFLQELSSADSAGRVLLTKTGGTSHHTAVAAHALARRLSCCPER